jgi:hypothetical protein
LWIADTDAALTRDGAATDRGSWIDVADVALTKDGALATDRGSWIDVVDVALTIGGAPTDRCVGGLMNLGAGVDMAVDRMSGCGKAPLGGCTGEDIECMGEDIGCMGVDLGWVGEDIWLGDGNVVSDVAL